VLTKSSRASRDLPTAVVAALVAAFIVACTGIGPSASPSPGGSSPTPPSSASATPSQALSPTPTHAPPTAPPATQDPAVSPPAPPTTAPPESAQPTATRPPALEPGDLAYISVAVATGWREPGSTRRVDAPALANPVRIRKWLASLSRDEQAGLIGRADTQVLLGEAVEVREIDRSWVRVTVPAQPTPLDRRGYPVWIPARQLTAGTATAATTATVTVPTAWLVDGEGQRELELSFGTRLPVVSARGDRIEVAIAGRTTLWLDQSDVVVGPAAGPALPASAASILRTARQFLGTRYLWAGTSGFGFDCSGLVYAVYRLHGIGLPRDSAPQATAGQAVARADLRPGDLVFFAARGRVRHVAIYVGGGRILESPSVGEGVREVALSSRAGYAGARRVLPGASTE
jgi:cell wall-associated NlpC family hydrolase